MADKNMIIVSVLAGILGLLSTSLGFAAEAIRIHVDDIYGYGYTCSIPSSPIFGLGIGAALSLLLSQVLLNIFGACDGCFEDRNMSDISNILAQANNRRFPAIIMIFASWITFMASITMLLMGAIKGGTCEPFSHVYFRIGPALSFITVGLGIGAYFLLHSTKIVGIVSAENPGIAGQMQFQQQGYAQGGPPQQGTNQTQQQNYYPPPAGYGYNTQTQSQNYYPPLGTTPAPLGTTSAFPTMLAPLGTTSTPLTTQTPLDAPAGYEEK